MGHDGMVSIGHGCDEGAAKKRMGVMLIGKVDWALCRCRADIPRIDAGQVQ